MHLEYVPNNSTEYNSGLISLNNILIEQAEIDEYVYLIKAIVTQLDSLLKPVVTVYSEYDTDQKLLRIKEINANKKVLNLILKIGGERILSTVTPVSGDMYKSMTLNRLEVISSLHEASGEAISESLSNTIGKALNMNCYLVISFMVDGQLYGTTLIALKEQPEQYILELLKTYAHFTSISLKRVLTEQALKKSEQELKTITENMTDMVSMTNAEGRITYVSGSYRQLLGYDKDELLGKEVFEVVFEEDLPEVSARFYKAIATGENDSVEYRAVKKDGTIIWLETLGNFLTDSNGLVNGAIFCLRDITDRKKFEEALKESEQKYRQIAENISDVVWISDLELNITYLSPSIEKLIGESPNDHLQRSLEEMFPPDSLNKILTTYQEEMEKEKDPFQDKNRTRIIEVGCYRVDGSTIWVSMHISALRNNEGTIIGLQGITRDITDRKKAEEQVRYLGYHDSLTGLYNRHYFEKCKEELKEISPVSVIMTDVNGLKMINDTYGHKVGDEILIKYAELIRKTFKHSDLFFRWGGDEFVIILKNTEEVKSWELCNRLTKSCSETFANEIPLSISVGVSSKLPGEDINKAIQEAEDMMYKNKLNESKSSKNLIMKTLLQTLSEKSFETKEHIDRMSLIGKRFGKKLNLPPSELSRLETLTMLHDIGKINIDGCILMKENTLTEEEWEEIKKHSEVGYRITRTAEEFAYIAEEILNHHERWDGTGYPQGLAGDRIPYLARILNLIDSYDVMNNGRPYKKKMSTIEIIEEVKRCSGKQFDPDLAEEFVAFLKEGYIKV